MSLLRKRFTQRHKCEQKVYSAKGYLIIAALFVCFLLTGCQEDNGFTDDNILNEKLIGTWAAAALDIYAITENHLTYTDWQGEISYAGAIVHVSNFNSSKSIGVIIIEYDSEHKPTYYSDEHWGDFSNPESMCMEPDCEHILPLKGNFIGIYYKTLKPGISVQMGGAYEHGGAEEETLDDAINSFTVGNEGSYMSWYGTYLFNNEQ